PPTVRIIHSGLACNIEEERYSERVYTIREGETLELTCLVTGHPRPQNSLQSVDAFGIPTEGSRRSHKMAGNGRRGQLLSGPCSATPMHREEA
ncbi:UNVERIFIED_CONTAM: hypothetical protein K2H54_005825, partial [Gekko kuhli]